MGPPAFMQARAWLRPRPLLLLRPAVKNRDAAVFVPVLVFVVVFALVLLILLVVRAAPLAPAVVVIGWPVSALEPPAAHALAVNACVGEVFRAGRVGADSLQPPGTVPGTGRGIVGSNRVQVPSCTRSTGCAVSAAH